MSSTSRKPRNWLGALPAPGQDGTEGKAVTEEKAVTEKVITVEFDFEKDTTNFKRFAEVVPRGKSARIGKIYVPKDTLKELGDPQTFTLTITVR